MILLFGPQEDLYFLLLEAIPSLNPGSSHEFSCCWRRNPSPMPFSRFPVWFRRMGGKGEASSHSFQGTGGEEGRENVISSAVAVNRKGSYTGEKEEIEGK